MDSVYSEAKKIIDTVKDCETCLNCGTRFQWTENQWRRNCVTCGQVMVRESKMPQSETKCWICLDTGIANYSLQRDGMKYEYGAICTCVEGTKARTYETIEGRKTTSKYIPLITEALFAPPVETIAKQNRERVKE